MSVVRDQGLNQSLSQERTERELSVRTSRICWNKLKTSQAVKRSSRNNASPFLAREEMGAQVAGTLHDSLSQNIFSMGILLDLWTTRREAGDHIRLKDLQAL